MHPHVQPNIWYCHDITPFIIKKYSNNIISLDDSLFSHYYYIDLFKEKPILSITTSYLNESDILRKRYVEINNLIQTQNPYDYIKRYFETNQKYSFMTYSELIYLYKNKLAHIAFHSHLHDIIITSVSPIYDEHKSLWTLYKLKIKEPIHKKFYIRWGSKLSHKGYYFDNNCFTPRKINEWKDFIAYDTECGLKVFKDLNIKQPDIYVFPFNESSEELIELLRKFGFKYFLGKERKELSLR